MGDNERPAPKKRTRKPRGRGLRAKTGCLTCRKRHKKCDEKQPVCGPCSIASRDCVFPRTEANPAPSSTQMSNGGDLTNERVDVAPSAGSPNLASRAEIQAVPSSQPPVTRSPLDFRAAPSTNLGHYPAGQPSSTELSLNDASFGWSPETIYSEPWTTDFASTRWLSLVATDAANADSGFSLGGSGPGPSLGAPDSTQDPDPAVLGPDEVLQAEQLKQQQQQQTYFTEAGDPERRAWQLNRDITLTSHEAVLFRHFTDHVTPWLDLLDPSTPFSSQAVRLALRNVGVMKAILAMAAKHIHTTEKTRTHHLHRGIPSEELNIGGDRNTVENRGDGTDDNIVASSTEGNGGRSNNETEESTQYYYETLHYVQEALAYNSYTHSEELLVTVVVISTYEMLDESDGRRNWQRHLKGVFWIQRSQNTDGECGGLRQAIWWSWLRQDIWAAFREKRRCLSIWKPRLELHQLTQHQLACRAVYLLSQAVNFCSNSGMAAETGRARDELLRNMDTMKSFWGDPFKPLPTSSSPADAGDAIFNPLWIHPPQFGIAVQAYNFALILITLHSRIPPGFNGYLKVQRTLSEAVDTICGIAMEMKDPACQVISAQCLYGAGLCVQDPSKREKILSLIRDCEKRVGWAPMATWRDDLRQEWAKSDTEYEKGP